MRAPRILVVGRHPDLMAKVLGLLESAGYVAVGALADDEAIQSMNSSMSDALLLGGGVESASRRLLADAFQAARPGRPIIEHFGGPQGLLEHVRQAVGPT